MCRTVAARLNVDVVRGPMVRFEIVACAVWLTTPMASEPRCRSGRRGRSRFE